MTGRAGGRTTANTHASSRTDGDLTNPLDIAHQFSRTSTGEACTYSPSAPDRRVLASNTRKRGVMRSAPLTAGLTDVRDSICPNARVSNVLRVEGDLQWFVNTGYSWTSVSLVPSTLESREGNTRYAMSLTGRESIPRTTSYSPRRPKCHIP